MAHRRRVRTDLSVRAGLGRGGHGDGCGDRIDHRATCGAFHRPVGGPSPSSLLSQAARGTGPLSAGRIGSFCRYPQSRALAELLIDCEEDRTLRAVLVWMLRERERRPDYDS
jgi:hypothetical protein